MDPYSVYAKQLEYYEYVQKQMSNPVNLTNTAQSSTIRLMAERIFSKTDTTANLYGILTDETLDAADIFGILVELVLYGLDILTKQQIKIFDIKESTDDIIFKIKRYLKSLGFDMKFHEEVMFETKINVFRDRTDWFYEIAPKPTLNWWCPPADWYVLNYRLIPNKLFDIINNSELSNYKAFYISSENKVGSPIERTGLPRTSVFTLQFSYYKNV